MGRPKAPPASAAGAPSYRDDPDAVSLHTTPDDYQYTDAPELPSYDDSIGAPLGDAAPDGSTAPPPPADEYAPISQPAPISKPWKREPAATPASQGVGPETSIRMDESLMDADRLHEYVTNYLRVVPPRPCVRIQGWHWRTTTRDNKKHQEKQTDFDIVFSLQQFLAPGGDGGGGDGATTGGENEWWAPRVLGNSDKAYRGSWRRTRAEGFTRDLEVGDVNSPPSLEDVCREFAGSRAALRAFRVSRTVTGLDTGFLEAEISQLVRSTSYLGHVDVTFPTGERNVDIYSPHWVNRARISWVRWVFYLTFLWIFTWPVLFFLTRWWALYEVEWRFSVEDDARGRGGGGRRFAVMSEERWINLRTSMIPNLVLNQYVGDATDVRTNSVNRDRSVTYSRRGSETGNPNVDAAVGLIRGGVSAWNALSGRSSGRELDGWGADERC